MGKNICKCPSPPGGTVECPDHYMPFCIIKKDEEPRHLCLPPIQSVDSVQIVNRVLSVILGKSKNLFSTITDQELIILQQGIYITEDTTVTFMLTFQVQHALNELINNRGGMNRGFEMEVEVT